MSVTLEQLEALERWAAQSPYPVTNIVTEYKAQKQRIVELEKALKKAEWSEHAEAIAEDLHCSVCFSSVYYGEYPQHNPACVVGQALSQLAALEEKP